MTEHAELLKELEARVKAPKVGKVHKKVCTVWGIPDLKITRWKFNEWDYYSEKAMLPIKARGLFTLENRIIVRGYNKFFNIGETKASKIENLKERTVGPYYATVKENGYLVLISALNGKLIVTSKNSSGPDSTNDVGRNYSEAARSWVFKHLKSKGKTEEEFAQLLEQNNWTAVGEVCDDSFEEHVLSYPEEDAGIYLNGLNHNTCIFSTESPEKVVEVSENFGFRRTDFKVFNDFEGLMAFLENAQKTGKWQDREVEGFVIRCKRTEREGTEVTDFFFKYKFEEPYFMYRQWREVVKIYLRSGPVEAFAKAKKSKHSESSIRFLNFARNWLEEHPELKTQLLDYNLGIIDLRTNFFQHYNLDETKLLELDINTPKWLLITVATLGCGKSTVSSALELLLKGEWGHEQSDAVSHGKSGRFQKLVSSLSTKLASYDVAILDRNNSGIDERKKVFTSFDEVAHGMGYNMNYVCLNFLPEGPSKKTGILTRSLVMARGDNHQTVRVSELSEKGVNNIMTGFEKRFVPVNPRKSPDDQFDYIIDLRPGQSVQNVKTVLTKMRAKYEKLQIPEFSDKEIEDAVAKVRADEASLAKAADTDKKKKTQKFKLARGYFGIKIDDMNYKNLLSIAKDLIEKHDPKGLEGIRIQDHFHITFTHFKGHKAEFNAMIKQYKDEVNAIMEAKEQQNKKAEFTPLGEKFNLTVTELAWNTRSIAFRVIVQGREQPERHITVGSAENVPAAESALLFSENAEGVNTVEFPQPFHIENQDFSAFLY